jgi:hypothetical protein
VQQRQAKETEMYAQLMTRTTNSNQLGIVFVCVCVQATSNKQQATSNKQQATSNKQ